MTELTFFSVRLTFKMLPVCLAFLPSDNVSCMCHPNLNGIYRSSAKLVVLLYHSEPTDIPCFLLKSSYLRLPPFEDPRLPYYSSTLHPRIIGRAAPVSSLLLLLAAWESLSASLYRRIRRDIATWVVTEVYLLGKTVLCRRIYSPTTTRASCHAVMGAKYTVPLLNILTLVMAENTTGDLVSVRTRFWLRWNRYT